MIVVCLQGTPVVVLDLTEWRQNEHRVHMWLSGSGFRHVEAQSTENWDSVVLKIILCEVCISETSNDPLNVYN